MVPITVAAMMEAITRNKTKVFAKTIEVLTIRSFDEFFGFPLFCEMRSLVPNIPQILLGRLKVLSRPKRTKIDSEKYRFLLSYDVLTIIAKCFDI